MTDSSNRFVVLDGMRGVAAVVVVLYHGTSHAFPMGYAAVDLFFVLSGFVLAHRYGEALSRPGNRLDFARHRFVRLYPLYLAGMGLGMIATGLILGRLSGWTPHTYKVALVLSPLFIPTPTNLPLGVFPFDGPAWSLFFEAVVNVVFAFTGARTRVAAGLAALSAPLVVLAIARWYAGGGSMLEDFPGGFARVAFSFFAGVLAYRVWRSGVPSRWPVPAPLLFLAMAAMYWASPSWESRYNALLVVLVQPLLILLGAAARPGWFSPVLSWLGAISYALYITHVPVLFLVAALLHDDRSIGMYLGAALTHARNGPHFPAILVSLPVAVGLAHVLTYAVEPHVRRWLNRVLPQTRPA